MGKPLDTTDVSGFAFRWACACSRDSILHDEGEVITDRFIDPNYDPGVYKVEIEKIEVPTVARVIVAYALDMHGSPVSGSFVAMDLYGDAPDSPRRNGNGTWISGGPGWQNSQSA